MKVRPRIDPSSDIEALLDNTGSDGQKLDAVCALPKDEIVVGSSREDSQNVSDSDKEWKNNRGTFEIIQEM